MNFGEWLNQKFLEWERTSGRRQTVTAFAEWLGVNRSLLSRYMNNKVEPGEDTVPLLAEKLGPDIYDILGLAHPNPQVREIQAIYNAMPPIAQKEIMDIVFDFAERHGYKKVK